MTLEEAKQIVLDKFPNYGITKPRETTNYFIMSIHPKSAKPKSSSFLKPKFADDGLMAVVKATKEVFTYNPIRHGE